MTKCQYCGKNTTRSSRSPNGRKYCSHKCYMKAWKKRTYPTDVVSSPNEVPRQCQVCGLPFVSVRYNQKYCSLQCQKDGGRTISMVCEYCHHQFMSRTNQQRYCSMRCSGFSKLHAIICRVCGQPFVSHSPTSLCCSDECRRLYHQTLQSSPAVQPVQHVPIFDTFNSLQLFREEEFVIWFEMNVSLFGIRKIVKLDPFFPDCRAELYTGEIIDIELEYFAGNFASHGHDPLRCDLIIAYCKLLGQDDVKGVPVISVFDITHYQSNGEHTTQVLSSFMRHIVDYATHYVNAVVLPRKPF